MPAGTQEGNLNLARATKRLLSYTLSTLTYNSKAQDTLKGKVCWCIISTSANCVGPSLLLLFN